MLWWTKRRLRSSEPSARVRAVSSLATSSAPEALDLLAGALADGDPEVREAVVEALSARDFAPRTDGERVRWALARGARLEATAVGAGAVGALARAIRGPDAEIAALAEEALRAIRDPAAVRPLFAISDGPSVYVISTPEDRAAMQADKRVQKAKVAVFRRLGVDALEPLLAALRDGARGRFELALSSAAAGGGVPGVVALTDALGDREALVSSVARGALESLGAEAIPGLIQSLAGEVPEVVAEAVRLLDRADRSWPTHPTASTMLVPLVLQAGSPNRKTCNNSRLLLDRIAPGSQRAPAILEVLPALVAALASPSVGVRQRATHTIAQADDAAVIAPLARAATDPERVVAEAAEQGLVRLVGALGAAGQEAAMAAFLGLLADPERSGRAASAFNRVLPDWPERAAAGTAVRDLVRCLSGADAADAANAALTIGRIGDEQASLALQAALVDDRQAVSDAAAQALEMMGWRPTDPAQAAALAVGRRDWVAVMAMGEEVIPALVALLGDPDERERAAVALGCLGDGALHAVLDAVSAEEPTRRAGSAYALGVIGDARALEPLRRALADPDEGVRVASIEALARCAPLGDAVTCDALAGKLDVRGDAERAAAVAAVETAGGESAGDRLTAALGTRFWNTRKQVMESLVRLNHAAAVGRIAQLAASGTESCEELSALERLLDCAAGDASSADLRVVLGIESVRIVVSDSTNSCGFPTTRSVKHSRDVGRARQLARQELLRRGETA